MKEIVINLLNLLLLLFEKKNSTTHLSFKFIQNSLLVIIVTSKTPEIFLY